jgi:hypothetical protein
VGELLGIRIPIAQTIRPSPYAPPRIHPVGLDTALRGLDSNADYEVTFAETYDVKEKRVITGAELGKLRVEIGSAPGVMLVRYPRVPPP